ncbi:hypothetical protein A4A49_54385 [Nicotiana attenuata]|uniref:Uncharacterized protein n=1 Tax=Nicotiana attenuata TaxID=49451 RepID=A0A1J6ILB4_NICAT|nr:hypothetical protein A4A49_54385 [Nicotiana attenuata]
MIYYVDDETDKEWSVAVDENEIYENQPYQQQELEQFFDDAYENIQIAIDEHMSE